MKETNKRWTIFVPAARQAAVVLVSAAMILGGCGRKEDPFETLAENETWTTEAETEETVIPEVVVVHVCGEVKNPGVYTLKAGSRVFDAVEAAGGFTEEADEDDLNLAGTLCDGTKLYICSKEETRNRTETKAEAFEEDGRVDLNTADRKTLMTLPGIGEAKAEAIISYREKNGPFSVPEDLMKISGIKAALYEKLRDLVKTG